MKQKSFINRVGNLLYQQKALAFIGIILLIMAVAGPRFYSLYNFMEILKSAAVYEVLAFGVTLTIICGGCDLSVGHNMCLAGIIAIMLMSYLPIWLCVIIAVAAGALVGFVNGFLCVHQKTAPFIVTLGMDMLLKGLCQFLSDAHPVPGSRPEFALFGNGKLFGVPYLAIIAIALLIVFWIILRLTPFGRNCYAIGGDYNVAVYSGIKAVPIMWLCFVISGMTAALGGVMLSARFNSGSSIYGENTALIVNCGAVLGGTSFAGGVGGIPQTALGLLLFTLLENSMNILQITAYTQLLMKGVIIALVLGIDYYAQKRKAEAV